jgi:hypothetical protein
MPGKSKNSKESGEGNGLTSIRPGIHCPATTERVGGQDEIDEIAIDNFLDTLAQLALAVASRKLAKAQLGGEVDR